MEWVARPGHIAAHGVVGCVSGYIGGGGCGHQAFAAAFTKAATPWISGLPNNPAAQISAAAAIGGTASVIGGGKFRNGAMTGAYGYINNFLLNVAITTIQYGLPLVGAISQYDNIKTGWKALSSKMFSEGADSGTTPAAEPAAGNGQRPSKTPNEGVPGSTVVNPGSGQERTYGPDGKPLRDVDWDHDHGQGVPHAHDWVDGKRGPGVPVKR